MIYTTEEDVGADVFVSINKGYSRKSTQTISTDDFKKTKKTKKKKKKTKKTKKKNRRFLRGEAMRRRSTN